jgi:hypothetical protein
LLQVVPSIAALLAALSEAPAARHETDARRL